MTHLCFTIFYNAFFIIIVYLVYIFLLFDLVFSPHHTDRGGRACLQHYVPHAGGDLTFHHQGHGHLHLPPAHRGVCWNRPF